MATTDDNLAVVRRLMNAYDQRDSVLLRELIASDHAEHPHWDQPLPLPGDDSQPILDRYEQADANTWTDFRDMQTTIGEQFACGDRVVTIWTAQASLAGMDKSVTIRGITVDRIADGKIAETWVSMDRLGIFQQLGVVESTRDLVDRAGLTI